MKRFFDFKLVEIIGEDEAYNLDPEIYLLHLLNQNNLKKLEAEILISALPKKLITI